MKYIILFTLLLSSLFAKELIVKANSFKADQKAGLSVFQGSVHIVKEHDELNASKLTIFTNKKHEPTKYIAIGDVSFTIVTKNGAIYKGVAQKVIYKPSTKEYYFYKDVYLKQVDEKKEIIGNEVVLNTVSGKAHAKGKQDGPVIMIFNIPEEEEK